MKKHLLIIAGLLISFLCFSQKSKLYKKLSKGMVYCPSGNYTQANVENTDSNEANISISGFFISNEITNKEYRQFYDYIKSTPNDTIYWFDYEKMVKEEPYLETADKNNYLKKESHKDVMTKLMDQSIWDSTQLEKDYFKNPKYDSFPVVGVTYKGAIYYCIWRTNKENEKRKAEGKLLIDPYRIPFELEWEYAASTASRFK